MIKESLYHTDWQKNRINFILSLYPKEFFLGKRILELGSFNGYIGAYFQSLGAHVHCLEGRTENVVNIINDYPNITAEVANLDTNEWIWGKWDIIINFGLYYHLEKYHKEHLINCISNCNLMFFETVIYDSKQSEIYFRSEPNDKFLDQSLSQIGGTPSTSFVENIFNNSDCFYQKYTSTELNGGLHLYDWNDTGIGYYSEYYRRFWVVKND